MLICGEVIAQYELGGRLFFWAELMPGPKSWAQFHSASPTSTFEGENLSYIQILTLDLHQPNRKLIPTPIECHVRDNRSISFHI